MRWSRRARSQNIFGLVALAPAAAPQVALFSRGPGQLLAGETPRASRRETGDGRRAKPPRTDGSRLPSDATKDPRRVVSSLEMLIPWAAPHCGLPGVQANRQPWLDA